LRPWQGLTNREIGKIIGTTEQVVKNHLRSTFDTLGVWSRLELAMYVASHGGSQWPLEPERTTRKAAPWQPFCKGVCAAVRDRDVNRPSNAKAFTKGRPGQYFRYNNLNVCSVLRM